MCFGSSGSGHIDLITHRSVLSPFTIREQLARSQSGREAKLMYVRDHEEARRWSEGVKRKNEGRGVI